MEMRLSRSIVRSWRPSDVDALARYANNIKIARNLRDAFPHPYTRSAAQAFIRASRERIPETAFAIEVDHEAVGGIGLRLNPDVERVSAEIGYWLGEPFWGRGIVSEALAAVTEQAIVDHGLTRIYALPFATNAASCRVLEKAGYVLEARLKRSAIKDDAIVDQLQYSFIAADPPLRETPG